MDSQFETEYAAKELKKEHFRFKEWLIERIIQVSGIITIITVVLIFIFLLRYACPTFKENSLSSLLLGRSWYPLSGTFGMLPLILGSFMVTIGAVVVGVPIGVGAAIYIGEIAPNRVREILKPTVEVLAAIPSVVIGFLGMVLLAPFLQNLLKLPTGLTALAGSIMLAFMAMPTIISISEDALHAVPQDYRAGSLAMGATKWQTISRVVVPAARSGILAACMLGIGRAIGETMTVLMVTGNAAVIPHTYLQPVRTMTATIAAEMGETAQGSSQFYSLFAVGLVLFLITFIINLVADLALQKSRR
jgi:phosphate transport system permease protein